jgi:hypothetical protein
VIGADQELPSQKIMFEVFGEKYNG